MLVVAAPATAIPEPKGCAASASVWTEVSFNGSGETFRGWYEELGDGDALKAALETDLWETEEEFYSFMAWFFSTYVDRNGDLKVCVDWLGGRAPGQPYWIISIVDNNSNARR